ncbi:hypothetical protein ACIGKQ_22415 [Gordonia sp. NPDC062954]|uniref:hypothetical protein n=1 Tax=Gordonia sp. NPDC062954 TaxID=3364003 RepID=UPI0037C5D4A7
MNAGGNGEQQTRGSIISQSNTRARGQIAASALTGAVVGLAAVIGWRYASPRQFIDFGYSAREISGHDSGYFFTFDYLQSVAGPRWFPELLVLPLVGVLIGAVMGLAALVVPAPVSGWRTTAVQVVSALLIGAGMGLVVALYARQVQPALLIQPVKDPSFVPTDTDIGSLSAVRGAPPYLDMSPELVYFPLVGAFCAAIVRIILESIRRMIRS